MKRSYSKGNLTVFWDSDKCLHSGRCFGQLSKVFDPKRRPWIDLEAADTAEIKRVIDTCPSGALSYKTTERGKPAVTAAVSTKDLNKIKGGKMSKSEEYLKEAFAGESQANRKYLAFAAAADKEGYAQAARLFRAAAEAETIHAHNHLRAVKGINTTKENLNEAISGESHEFTEMYPQMLTVARAEGNKDAERTFNWANEVEKIHAKLYQGLLDNLGAAKDAYPYYVCPVCGNTVAKEAPDTCPICGASGKMFKKID